MNLEEKNLETILIEKYRKKKKKPNIFKVLKLTDYEIRHSNFLAWLFDPEGSHEFGSLFFKLFIKSLDKNVKIGNIKEVQREGKTQNEFNNGYMDILVTDEETIWVIENKYGASETKQQNEQNETIGQLEYYHEYIEKNKGTKTPIYIYLDTSSKNYEKLDSTKKSIWRLATYGENILPSLLSLKEKFSNQNITENQKTAFRYIDEYIDILMDKYFIIDDKDIDNLFECLKDEEKFEYYKKNSGNVIHNFIWWTVPYKYGKIIDDISKALKLEKVSGWTQEFVVRTYDCLPSGAEGIKGTNEDTANQALVLHFDNKPQDKYLKLQIIFTLYKRVWECLQEVTLLEGDNYFENYNTDDDALKDMFTTKITNEKIIEKYNEVLAKLKNGN